MYAKMMQGRVERMNSVTCSAIGSIIAVINHFQGFAMEPAKKVMSIIEKTS